MFCNGRVDHALGTEFVQQALGNLVGTLILGDLFPHQEDIGIAAHFFGHCIAQRFANRGLLDLYIGVPIGADIRGGGLWRGCGRFCRGLRRGLFLGFGRGGARSGLRHVLAFFHHNGDHVVDLHTFSAFRHHDLADDPFIDSLEFHGGFVRLDLGQNIAGRNGITFLHEPLGQRAFFHGGREGGHQNFGCHVSSLLRDFGCVDIGPKLVQMRLRAFF